MKKRITALVLIMFLLLVASETIRVYGNVVFGETFADRIHPFSYVPENPDMRILLVGDSTAVGVGAIDPRQSIAGFLHRDYPNAQIINRSVTGNRTGDVRDLIEEFHGSFDVVIIHAGANDIVHFTSQEELREDAEALVRRAKTLAPHVLLVTAGNVSQVPFFPAYSTWLFGGQAAGVVDVLGEIAAREEILFINFQYEESDENPFAGDMYEWFAPDQFHPSGRGYEEAYRVIHDALAGAGALPVRGQ